MVNKNRSLNTSILKKILDEKGIDYYQFAGQMKKSWNVLEKDTMDMIFDEKHPDLHDKFKLALTLRVRMVDLNH